MALVLEKVDSNLQIHIERSGPSDDLVRVLLTWKVPLDDATWAAQLSEPIALLGFQVGIVAGNMATGAIPINNVDALSNLPNTERIDLDARVTSHLKTSRPATHADLVQPLPIGQQVDGYDGEGVVVAIIDGGIDYRHGTFRKDGGTGETRIVGLWDQTTTPWAPGLGYGQKYTSAQINSALLHLQGQPGQAIAYDDGGRHGSHVAAIAAGSGSIEPPSTIVAHFGIAPKADIMFVSNVGDEYGGAVGEAIEWIAQTAKAMGPNKRAVINMSLGYTGFACDGNSPMDRLMNNLAVKHSHIVLVASAGNSGADGCHFQGDIPASGHIDVKLEVKGTNRCTVHIWQAKTEISTFTVIPPPDSKRAPAAPFTAGQGASAHQFPYGNVCRIASSIHEYSQKRRTTFVLEKADWFELYEGVWTIRVQGPAPFPGSNRRFHAWVDVNDWSGRSHDSPKLVGATPATTLESPGTADLVIAVGAYTVRATEKIKADQPKEGLAFFSSQGPLLDDALQPSTRLKPDISAPGLLIHSADNRLDKDPTFEFVGSYFEHAGTSMASPHVAGVIALLLQKEPNLTRQEVYDRITQNARRDDKTGATANAQWGYGKLDAWAALYPGVNLPP